MSPKLENNGKKKMYFNRGQQETMFISAKHEYIVASRRFGKSDGIVAPRVQRNAQTMPRGMHAIVARTYKQALTRTLPATIQALQRFGFKLGKHYYIGRKAPKKANFKEPHVVPADWEHVIHWYNGSIFHIISQDVPFSSNSLTLDSLIADEGRSLNFDKLKDETIPALGGFSGYFKDVPWHRGVTVVTDMPQGSQGQWILDKEKECDTELIDTIKAIIFEIWKNKKANTAYAINRVAKLQRELNTLRKHATLYREFNAIDNLAILGEDYIAQMKRDLPPLIFHTSILNKRIRKIRNGFYAALTDSVHYYDADDIFYLNNFRSDYGDIDFSKAKNLDCYADGDLDPNKPLYIALDYNADINWLVVAQPDYEKRILYTLKSFFVKTPAKIKELLKDFNSYYTPQRNRNPDVVYYYNHTALQGAYASTNDTFADEVKDMLYELGWSVTDKYIGQAMPHKDKHRHIDAALKGQKHLFPYFNRSNNEFLLPAMEATGIVIGKDGFKKDKSEEKLDDTPDNPKELRTDGTDAWDDLWIGCNFHPVEARGSAITLINSYK